MPRISTAISPIVYARGAAGVPSTTYLASLQGRMDSYSHAVSASGGFESCSISFAATKDEGLFWLDQLMSSLYVYGPEAQTCWEGFLGNVTVQFGQEQLSLSLDDMANRVRTRWTTVYGLATTTTPVTNAASIALYGTKDRVLSLNVTAQAAAEDYADQRLAALKNPTRRPTSTVATGDLGEVRVTLDFAGWYYTLGWVVTSRDDVSTESTTTQVGALIGTASPGIGATNPFLSTSTQLIASSGVTAPRTISADTPYLEKIETLLKQGTSAGQRLAWGVYEGRKFKAVTWAGASPSTVTYRRRLEDGQVLDAYDGVVAPWDVRPDAIYAVSDLAAAQLGATTQDARDRFYVERVTCSLSGDSLGVSLEPEQPDALDAVLAGLTNW